MPNQLAKKAEMYKLAVDIRIYDEPSKSFTEIFSKLMNMSNQEIIDTVRRIASIKDEMILRRVGE